MGKTTLIEYILLFGTIGIVVFVPIKQFALGAILSLLGAFFPSSVADKLTGDTKLKIASSEISISGTIRLGVIAAGLIVLLLAGKESFDNASETGRSIEKDEVSRPFIDLVIGLLPGISLYPEAFEKFQTESWQQSHPKHAYTMYIFGCRYGLKGKVVDSVTYQDAWFTSEMCHQTLKNIRGNFDFSEFVLSSEYKNVIYGELKLQNISEK